MTVFEKQIIDVIDISNGVLPALVTVTVNYDQLTGILLKLLEAVRDQARFLDTLENTYATKEEMFALEKRCENKFVAKTEFQLLSQQVINIKESVGKLEERVAVNEKKAAEAMENLRREMKDIASDLSRENKKTRDKIVQLEDKMAQDALVAENLYTLFDLNKDDVTKLLNRRPQSDGRGSISTAAQRSARQEEETNRKMEMLLGTPIFGNILTRLDTKTDKIESDLLRADLDTEKNKLDALKRHLDENLIPTIKATSQKEIESSLKVYEETVAARFTEAKEETESQLALKATIHDMDKKAETDYVLSLYDRMTRDFDQKMAQLDEVTQDRLLKHMSFKVNRDEFVELEKRVMNQNTTNVVVQQVQQQAPPPSAAGIIHDPFAAARYKCLVCGSPEPPRDEYGYIIDDSLNYNYSRMSPPRKLGERGGSRPGSAYGYYRPRSSTPILGNDGKVYRGGLRNLPTNNNNILNNTSVSSSLDTSLTTTMNSGGGGGGGGASLSTSYDNFDPTSLTGSSNNFRSSLDRSITPNLDDLRSSTTTAILTAVSSSNNSNSNNAPEKINKATIVLAPPLPSSSSSSILQRNSSSKQIIEVQKDYDAVVGATDAAADDNENLIPPTSEQQQQQPQQQLPSPNNKATTKGGEAAFSSSEEELANNNSNSNSNLPSPKSNTPTADAPPAPLLLLRHNNRSSSSSGLTYKPVTSSGTRPSSAHLSHHRNNNMARQSLDQHLTSLPRMTSIINRGSGGGDKS